jgi:hypothetical protein
MRVFWEIDDAPMGAGAHAARSAADFHGSSMILQMNWYDKIPFLWLVRHTVHFFWVTTVFVIRGACIIDLDIDWNKEPSIDLNDNAAKRCTLFLSSRETSGRCWFCEPHL